MTLGSNTNSLQQALAQRILVIDGAMGTMVQAYELAEADFRGERFSGHSTDLKGNNDLLSLTRPDVIHDIHRAYLTAGADIIKTNSFNASAAAQGDYDLGELVPELNLAAAKIARNAVREVMAEDPQKPRKPRFVAGVLGPTPRTASISPDVNDPVAWRSIVHVNLGIDIQPEGFSEAQTFTSGITLRNREKLQ